jgi:hypothetical protein
MVTGGARWIPPFCLVLVASPSSLGGGAVNPRSSACSFGSILGGVSMPRLRQPPARCCACDG